MLVGIGFLYDARIGTSNYFRGKPVISRIGRAAITPGEGDAQ